MKNFLKSKKARLAALATTALTPFAVHASVLSDEVNTQITAAKADQSVVGGYIISLVAGMIIVTIILKLMKKI